MVEQRLPSRATGLARSLYVLVLLAGIVAMHAAVFAVHGHAETTADHAAARTEAGLVQMHAVSTGSDPKEITVGAQGSASPAGQPVADHPAQCAGDGCGGTHGGMHGCVFVLAAAALLLGLVLLYRLPVDRPGGEAARLRRIRPRRERSPPWTVLSLAELAILRI
ncbi:hypothetical protein DFR70_102374 [Nocardia tenerifensis]|uniref:Uncharacterized protein n=1 Tax=Nocardia tenerifensis TaxID=228006 RepID=A0A318KBU0_9NOCA|nr:DUF6153 family protein [Nocardia tenerifensis]PXX68690.1 hypothetical protein DFR70_102374 [Nocardia tenerifensis]